MRAIVMREFGGPDVLRLEDVPEPAPRGGHSLVDVALAGINYADVHVRGDSYLAPVELPYVPGNEVVGTVDGGRRVAGLCRGGGYAERTLLHRRVTWDIPDAISDEQAVALALQGNSAWHLLFTSLRLTEGETVVVPAAAGASDRWPSSSPRAPAPGSSLSRAPRKSANWPGNWAPTRWWTRPPRI